MVTAIVTRRPQSTTDKIMFRNYLKIAFRNLWRHKTFSLINVLGLSIGISAALVIFLMTYYEFSFDRFIPDRERIYRIVLDINVNGNEGHSPGVQAPLGPAIQNEITGIEYVVPVFQFQGEATAKVSITKAGVDVPVVFKRQPRIVFTNTEYFYLLPYDWIAGSTRSAMLEPFSTVLTESRAKLYFPGIPATDVIGRQIVYNSDLTTTVTGIVKDLNENTSFNASEFISLSTIYKTGLQKQFMMDDWSDWMAYSQLYIKKAKGYDVKKLEESCTNLIKKNNPSGDQAFNNGISCRFQPLADIHFNNHYSAMGQRIANKPMLIGLVLVAAFLLLLACINYINLTTANAVQRTKEIGIRKTMGSSRKSLVLQYLGETFFITCMATILSICLTPILIRIFKDYMPDGIQLASFNRSIILLFLFILTALVSFLSGLYPGLILSGLQPVATLKGQGFTFSDESRRGWIRKALTVSQFVIAQFFLIATVVVSKQIHYSMNTDLGFNKDAIITFELPRDTVKSRPNQLLNLIKSIPEVSVASSGFLSPADLGVAFTNVKYEGKPDLKENIQIRWGDPDFINVYQLKLLAGKNVEQSTEMKEFIINEKYSKLLGFDKPSDALGKYLEFNGKKLPIVAVMQDFHDLSMRGDISPLVFGGNTGSIFHIRLHPNDAQDGTWRNGINKIRHEFKTMYPDADFSYQFFDDTIASMYINETKTASLLKWATGLAILISCLGLIGLVMYTINSRKKEIGIRKILGSSVLNIISILSKDFIRLILIAYLVAVPLAWWIMHRWLSDFAFRTELSWWVFVASGFLMLFIAILTLSAQTLRAAIANPVKSLRTE